MLWPRKRELHSLGNIMIKISQPSVSSGSAPATSVRKIASGTINAAVLGMTALAWEATCSLDNTIPLFMITTRVAGSFDSAVMNLKIGSSTIASVSLVALASDAIITSLTIDGTVSGSSSLDTQVATANIEAASFSVHIYGMKY